MKVYVGSWDHSDSPNFVCSTLEKAMETATLIGNNVFTNFKMECIDSCGSNFILYRFDYIGEDADEYDEDDLWEELEIIGYEVDEVPISFEE